MTHPVDRYRRAAAGWALVLLASCATTPPPAAVRPRPLPEGPQARELALGQIGRQLYAALADGEPERLMLDASELKSIFDTDGAMRVLELRDRGTAPGLAAAEQRAAYGGTTYGGVCFDRAREEPAGSSLGLLQPAFVFDRALVVGKQPDHSTVAAWIEGMFMGTGDLVVALVLSRVEAPRREHPDLELLQCDVVDGLESLKPIVGADAGK
ncbi:MAG TPA: hypothetical protein VFG30_38570 [Polyangiales bacterium]|nr:hypothetical protein [Polyangiales bacterium]